MNIPPLLRFLLLTLAAGTLLLLTATRAAHAQQALPLVRVAGDTRAARLVSWNEEEAAFELEGGAVGDEEPTEAELLTLPTAEVLAWGQLPAIEAGPVVVLASGGLLVAEPLSLRDETLRVYAVSWDEFSVPLAQVRGIIYRVPHTAEEFDARLAAIRQAEGDRDVVTLVGGDQVRGVILGLGPDGYTLETETGRVEIEADQVVQLVCAPALVEVPEAPTQPVAVGFRDGSYFLASSLELREGRLSIATAGLGTLSTPRGIDAAAELRLVQPLTNAATYLSDLEPHSYRHLPFLDTALPLGIDRNCLGGTLRNGKVAYLKGLGMHSASRAAFNLSGEYRRFQVELALDATSGKRGSVVYRVFAGTPDNWEQLYESPIVRGGEMPVAVDLDVRDREQLLLVIEYADQADQLDRANWLNARVLP